MPGPEILPRGVGVSREPDTPSARPWSAHGGAESLSAAVQREEQRLTANRAPASQHRDRRGLRSNLAPEPRPLTPTEAHTPVASARHACGSWEGTETKASHQPHCKLLHKQRE